MGLGASCDPSLSASVLTRVSVVGIGRGGCEICGISFKNHATFLAKVLIILVGGSSALYGASMAADADVGR